MAGKMASFLLRNYTVEHIEMVIGLDFSAIRMSLLFFKEHTWTSANTSGILSFY